MNIKYELTNYYDQIIVQYTINGGGTWTTLGSSSDPQWYNNTSYNSWNNATEAAWTKVEHNLCAVIGQPCVKFRITTSNLYYAGNSAYFAFDNFSIFSSPDVGTLSYVSPVNSGCNYVANQPVTIQVINVGCAAVEQYSGNLSDNRCIKYYTYRYDYRTCCR